MIHPCDRRTDGRAIAYTSYGTYAVARNKTTNISVSWSFLSQISGPGSHPLGSSCPFKFSTCIVTLNHVQRWQDYGHLIYTAYVDLHAAFN